MWLEWLLAEGQNGCVLREQTRLVGAKEQKATGLKVDALLGDGQQENEPVLVVVAAVAAGTAEVPVAAEVPAAAARL